MYIRFKYFVLNYILGIGDWGLGIGPNPQSPIPNPQSPIYNFVHYLNFFGFNKFYLYYYIFISINYIYKYI